MDFYDKLVKNGRFYPPNEPKGPQGPIGTPKDHENYFFELQGYEFLVLEKRVFEFTPIEKKWSNHTKRLGAILDMLWTNIFSEEQS